MNRKMIALAMAIMAVSAMPAKAQVVVDMPVITCKQFLDFDLYRQMVVASWMSGYFSATKNLSTVDLRYMERNDKRSAPIARGSRAKP
jgi:acid stress chaperone HdeB